MIARQDDEEIPFLHRAEQPTTKTPLPWDQFWIVLLLEMPDLLSSHTLTPFIPQLIRDIGVTNGDESQVGHYVGILQSSYYVAHALTVFHWSQLSDHIGRKPVMLIALSALSVSMFLFGLSKTFLGLVVSRVVCGAFDPSIGVIKSVLMDITDATNMPNAYNYMPLTWMTANAVGPLIGGSLSRPADRFPDIFGRSELLKTYPYLLPCSVSAFFTLIAWLATYFCLKESVSTRTPLWKLIKRRFLRQSYSKPHRTSSSIIVDPGEANSGEVQSKPLPLRDLLTSRVLSITANYATTGLLQAAFALVQPLFFATSIELGGLSLDPPRIGALLAAQSVAHGICQLLFFTRLHDRFGAGAVYFTGVSFGIPIVILFPVINALARAYGIGMAVWLCVAVQFILKTSLFMCYSCLALFVRTAAPNRASVGATSGIIQTVAALAKIFGPASAASVFSYSLQEGHNTWLIYYFLIAIAFLAVGAALLLPRDPSVWEDHRAYHCE